MPAAIRAMVSPLITTTRVWKLHRAPLAALGDDTFELTTEELPPIKQNEILVQTTYLSNGS
jgi:NADPH-dependent curcumin reductase CurA